MCIRWRSNWAKGPIQERQTHCLCQSTIQSPFCRGVICAYPVLCLLFFLLPSFPLSPPSLSLSVSYLSELTLISADRHTQALKENGLKNQKAWLYHPEDFFPFFFSAIIFTFFHSPGFIHLSVHPFFPLSITPTLSDSIHLFIRTLFCCCCFFICRVKKNKMYIHIYICIHVLPLTPHWLACIRLARYFALGLFWLFTFTEIEKADFPEVISPQKIITEDTRLYCTTLA